MLKNIPLIIALTASLVACGGSDDKKSSSSSSVALSSSTPAASSTPASSEPASSTPASSEAASSTPASSEAASSTPASSEAASSTSDTPVPVSSMPASSEPASSTPASSEPASSIAASSEPASSSSLASSSSAAVFDGTFTDQNTISFWSTTPTQPTGTATQAIVNGALVITPTWASIDDSFNVEATLPHTLDLTGATISFKVYVPESYVVDGKLAAQVYFKDATGKYANGGWKETAWGPWRWSGSETSTTNNASDNKFGWATLSFIVSTSGLDDINDTTDSAKWGWNPNTLDITKVTHFGIELVSKKKPIDVTGEIKIDDVVLPGL